MQLHHETQWPAGFVLATLGFRCLLKLAFFAVFLEGHRLNVGSLDQPRQILPRSAEVKSQVFATSNGFVKNPPYQRVQTPQALGVVMRGSKETTKIPLGLALCSVDAQLSRSVRQPPANCATSTAPC